MGNIAYRIRWDESCVECPGSAAVSSLSVIMRYSLSLGRRPLGRKSIGKDTYRCCIERKEMMKLEVCETLEELKPKE